ncbi:MAG: hypothetical protein JNK77_17895 [Saprospiraceae bacterium]|nr:hypothetical protein [Saprospiraceae bacterium]
MSLIRFVALIALLYAVYLFVPASPHSLQQEEPVETSDILDSPAAYNGKTIALAGCRIANSAYFLFAGCFMISDGAGGYLLGISGKRPAKNRCDLVAKVITVVELGEIELVLLAKVNQLSTTDKEEPLWTPERNL